MDKLVVSRRDAVDLLVGLGLLKASTWLPDKLMVYLGRVQEIGEAEDLADPRLRGIFTDLIKTTSIIVTDDPIETKHHKRVEQDWRSERVDDPSLKRPGVVACIINALLRASEKNPITKPVIFQELLEKFGPGTPANRNPKGMKNTLNGLTTWIKEPVHTKRKLVLHRNELGFWLTEG